MTAHKTDTHPVILLGVLFISTWCDTCHWTHTTPPTLKKPRSPHKNTKRTTNDHLQRRVLRGLERA